MYYQVDLSVLVTQPYIGWLLSGIVATMLIGSGAWLVALPLGTIIGIAGAERSAVLRAGARVYVEIFRNTPLIVQLFLWYFVLPELLPATWGHWLKRDLAFPEYWSAVLCIGFYTAARIAEQVRAGVQSVAAGQYSAALALGLRKLQAYRYILLPLCFRIIIPPLTSELLSVFKNTSLASAIGVLELTEQGHQIENYTFKGFEAFGAVTIVYFLITVGLVLGMRAIERRTALVGFVGGKR